MPLTILSANLLNPLFNTIRIDHPAWLARLEALAGLVESQAADIVLCQEVGRSREFRVDEWLAGRLGMAAVYQRANGQAEGRWGREEGVAILSRYPLSSPVGALLGGGLWRRPALGAVVAAPWGEVAVYTAHLSLRPWRNRRQPAKLRDWVAATAGGRPAIIGGDFNAEEHAPGLAALAGQWRDVWRAMHPTQVGCSHELKLFGRAMRRRRIDYLFLRAGDPGLRIAYCEYHTTVPPFSDHRAIVGRFEAGAGESGGFYPGTNGGLAPGP